MEKKELICIVCPKGCHLEVTQENEKFQVTGNQCKRGPVYAQKELTEPTRVLTTTVKIKNGILNRIPVVTEGEILKDSLEDAMQILNKIELEAPVKNNQVIIKDLLGSGVNVVVSRSMDAV